MKKLLSMLIGLGLVFSVASAVYAKDLKIGTIDVFKVFNEYQKTKDFDKVLESKRVTEEKKLTDKKNQVEQMQNKMALMSEAEKNKEKEKVAKAIDDYRNMEKTSFDTLKTERDEKMKEIIDDINAVIKNYATANGYDLIVNENTILYKDISLDITSTILKAVNDKYKK